MFSLIRLPNLQWIPKVSSPRRASVQLSKETIYVQEHVPSSEQIRDTITELLSQCHIPFYRTPYENDLHDLCIQECRLKGYPIDNIDGRPSILKCLPVGVCVASTAYAHLKDRSTQVFIALYCSFGTWIDDTFAGDVRGLDTFNERFVRGEKQCNEGLDGFARLLREINLHYYGIQANVILTSSLNFTTSNVLEYETRGMAVSPHAKDYATYLRLMSGASEAYAMFTFPPEIPIKTYIQAMPELCLVINYFNDVLSFYKEELVGDNGNYISNEASWRGQRKVPVLRQLAQDVSLCVSRVSETLDSSADAQAAFRCFLGGYVSAHTSCDLRYHLNDLFPLPQ